jgi:hypothetical protein
MESMFHSQDKGCAVLCCAVLCLSAVTPLSASRPALWVSSTAAVNINITAAIYSLSQWRQPGGNDVLLARGSLMAARSKD